MKIDYLIIGGGLAGMVLSRTLRRRGRSVLVIDWRNPASATRVAAGIVNPITGKNLVPTGDWEEFMAEALPFYRDWEEESGERLFYPLPIRRFLRGAREEALFAAKRHEPFFAQHARELNLSAAERNCLADGLPGFTIDGGGCLDTRALLRAGQEDLRAEGAFLEEKIAYPDISIGQGEVRWKGVVAGRVVFCEGWRASGNPWFSWIPFRHAKGEILTWRAEGFPNNSILNRGKWVAPFPDQLRAGATYEWSDLTETPTTRGRAEIEAALSKFLHKLPGAVNHQAGVRPIVSGSLPVVGLHPAHREIAILNGLGSKGALWAPRLSRQLADALEDTGGIDPRVDVRRNL